MGLKEPDLIYAGIKALEKIGLVWDVNHFRSSSSDP
jgi:hypothetical protein